MRSLVAAGKRHFGARLLAICVLCLLAAGCGSAKATAPKTTATPGAPVATATVSATAAPSPAATAPATTVTNTLYTSDDGVFSLSYPAGWVKQSLTNSDTAGAVGFASPDSADLFFIFPLTSHIDAGSYATVAQSFLEQGISATNVQLASSTGTITLPSGTWTSLDGGGTISGTTYDATQLALDHGAGTFFLYILVPDASANTDVTTYFEPMLVSFKFLK